MKEREEIILKKIKIYAIQTIDFNGNMDYVEFSNDIKTISACVFNLSQIGELVAKLDSDFTNVYKQIP